MPEPINNNNCTLWPRLDVVSNVASDRLEQIMMQLARDKILEKGKRLIVLERNPVHLNEIVQQFLGLIPRHIHRTTHVLQQHYRVSDGQVNYYLNLDELSDVEMVIARAKHPCSVYEKEIRRIADWRRINDIGEFANQCKTITTDAYGITLVTRSDRTGEVIDRVIHKILSMQNLELVDLEKHDKNSGYKSNHLVVRYSSDNKETNGLLVEVQVHDIESEILHKNGTGQAHRIYGAGKLKQDHLVPPDTQVVIYGGGVVIPDDIGPVNELECSRHVKVPATIGKRYDLVMPR